MSLENYQSQKVWQANTAKMDQPNSATQSDPTQAPQNDEISDTQNDQTIGQKPRKRRRLALSCDVCRKRKVKVGFFFFFAQGCERCPDDNYER